MEDTFLELPLDRDLYVPKTFEKPPKEPLRVLLTDAGGKIAYNLIFEICCGNIFGREQDVILHLINSRGSMNHKAVILELEQCGFAAFKDYVASCNPEVAYKDVDIVIVLATYEEIPGRSISNSLLYQMIKARQVALNVQAYSKKNAKIIFAGPSTKAVTILLSAFTKFAKGFPREHISSVTYLDVVISKAMIAAKLKTTTDKIKNVLIWATTFPDVHNATVHMYPPDDKGEWEMEDVPLAQAIEDDLWLFHSFPMAIYARVMTPDLIKFGKAVTMSVAKHLQFLFKGTDNFNEMVSMGVITPHTKVYGTPPDVGFSFPVKTKEGNIEILTGVKYNTTTHLNILRSIFNMTHSVMLNSIMKVVNYMLDYEATKKQVVSRYNRNFIEEVIESRNWINRYFITPTPSEGIPKFVKERSRDSKKSIAWDDESNLSKKKSAIEKSTIRFSGEKLKSEMSVRRNTYGKVEESEIAFKKLNTY